MRNPAQLLLTLSLPVLLPPTLLGCGRDEQLPPPVASDLEAPRELLFAGTDLVVGQDWAESRVLSAPSGATRIGLLLDVNDPAALAGVAHRVQVRGFDELGGALPWLEAEATFIEDRYLVARADAGQTVYGAQLRLPATRALTIEHIAFAAVIPEEHADAEVPETDLAQRDGALEVSGLVVPRAQWGARKTKCTSKDGGKSRIAIHHTFTPPGSGGSIEARLRSIQAYHMDTRGWCDVGYHYLVGDDGRVFEGRPAAYIGAHVANHNTGNIGVSFVGCFQTGECDPIGTMTPSAAALAGARSLLAALSDQYGIALTTTNVKGHTQHSGASTSCPGDRLLPRIPELLTGDPMPPVVDNNTPATINGVVFDASVTADPAAEGNRRIVGAIVSLSDGTTQTVSAPDAMYTVKLAPGTWTVVATASGYSPASRTITVAPGEEAWASVGLIPLAQTGDGPAVLSLETTGGTSLSEAVVQLGANDWRRVVGGTLSLPLTSATNATVYAPGMVAKSVQLTPGNHSAVALAPEPLALGGTFQGVVWDASVTASPDGAGAVRLSDAIVVCSCGRARRARLGDAYWSFTVPTGTHTFTAVATGYAAGSSQGAAGLGASEWGSIGLLKTGATPAPAPPTPAVPKSVCYPGANGAYDACFEVSPASAVTDPAYKYPTPIGAQYIAPARYLDLEAAAPATKLAKNFALSEFLSPAKGRWGVLAPKTVAHWQNIRAKLGVALQVNSGYRSPGWNDGIDGSASNSRHMWGDAADVTPGGGVSLTTLSKACKTEGADYVQVYTSHVHCDWRNDPLEPAFYGTGASKPGAHEEHPANTEANAEASASRLDPSVGDVVFLEATWAGFDEGTPWVRWEVQGPGLPAAGLRLEPAPHAAFEARTAGVYTVRWSVGETVSGVLVVEAR